MLVLIKSRLRIHATQEWHDLYQKSTNDELQLFFSTIDQDKTFDKFLLITYPVSVGAHYECRKYDSIDPLVTLHKTTRLHLTLHDA